MDPVVSIVSGMGPVVADALKAFASRPETSAAMEVINRAAHETLESTVKQFAAWIADRTGNAQTAEIPAWQRAFSLEQASLLAEVLRLSEEVTGSASAKGFIERDGHERKLIGDDRQMTVGLGFRNGTPIPVFLVEQRNERTEPVFAAIEGAPSGQAPWRVIDVGKLHMSNDDVADRCPIIDPHAWRIGRPVAFRGGNFGSIAAFVSYRDGSQRRAGFLSASHVLMSLRDQSGVGGAIASPVRPFVDRMSVRHRVGQLVDASDIVHYVDAESQSRVVNREDIGLVSLWSRPEGLANIVIDPSAAAVDAYLRGEAGFDMAWWAKATIPIGTQPADLDDVHTLTELYGGTVYKIGARSCLTCGVIEALNARSIRIKLSNNWNYLYGDLIYVRSLSPDRPFSDAGDSGALVYNAGGLPIGTIVAGKGMGSYVAPLDTALRFLKEHDCRLETASGFDELP